MQENDIDLGCELLGIKLPFPIFTAPMGIHGFFHSSTEAGSATQFGVLYTPAVPPLYRLRKSPRPRRVVHWKWEAVPQSVLFGNYDP